MRQLKFRIWDNHTKRYETCVYEAHKDCYLFIGRSGYVTAFNCYGEEIDFEDGRFVVQQYTGLKDKNGKEIYEGDIVQYNVGSSYENMSFIVQWSGDSLGYILQSQSGDVLTNIWTPNGNRFNFIELKGNNFENPELLEQ